MNPMMKPAGDPGQVAASRADMANQANSPAPGAEPGAEGKGGDPVKAMVMLGDSLDQLAGGLQKAGAPPEALDKLAQASAAYKDFLSILGGNAPSNAEEKLPGEEHGSVPPPQPGRPGIAPVKGRNIVPAQGAQGY